MAGHQWAKEPLSRIATAAVSIQQLYAELEIAVQLERETIAADVQRKPAAVPISIEMASINFSSQARYANGTRRNERTFLKNVAALTVDQLRI